MVRVRPVTDEVHIDFETRSRANIKKTGAERYALDPSTSMLCLAWAFGDEPEVDAIPFWENPAPRLIEHVKAGRPVWAHNAAFELAIWNYCLHARAPHIWPRLEPSQTYCTMAQAHMMALPGDLASLAEVLRIADQKDDAGKQLMLKLSKPDKRSGDFLDPAEDMPRLIEYCKQDVRAERGAGKHLVMLPELERRLWVLDHTINNRGVPIDVESVRRLVAVAQDERVRINDDVAFETMGDVSSANKVKALIQFLRDNDIETETLKAADISRLLAGDIKSEAARKVLELRDEARKTSAKKLDAMLARLCPDETCKGVHQFMGAGNTGRWAGRGVQTQNLKRTPKTFKVEDVVEWTKRDDGADMVRYWYGSVIDAVSLSVRGMIRAPAGRKLIANDYSNIEGRVLAWYAGETWKLEAFRDFDNGVGHDLYKVAYGRSFGKDPADVNDDERQIGKVQELALGYQGGVGAFASMAINYGIRVVKDDDETRGAKNTLTESQTQDIKRAWRKAHPNVEKSWHLTEEAAINAVRHRGSVFRAGPVAYRVSGNYLMCRLPSGRCLFYAGPSIIEVPNRLAGIRVEELCERVAKACEAYNEVRTADWLAICGYGMEMPGDTHIRAPDAIDISRDTYERAEYKLRKYVLDLQTLPLSKELKEEALTLLRELPELKRDALQTWGTDSKTRKWGRRRPYGGLLVENAVQAIARDILAAAMLRLEEAGYEIIMHVHDEIVACVPRDFGSQADMARIMVQLPTWARGLPIAASGWQGERYRK